MYSLSFWNQISSEVVSDLISITVFMPGALVKWLFYMQSAEEMQNQDVKEIRHHCKARKAD